MSAESEGYHDGAGVWHCNHCGKEIDSDHYNDIWAHVKDGGCPVLFPPEPEEEPSPIERLAKVGVTRETLTKWQESIDILAHRVNHFAAAAIAVLEAFKPLADMSQEMQERKNDNH